MLLLVYAYYYYLYRYRSERTSVTSSMPMKYGALRRLLCIARQYKQQHVSLDSTNNNKDINAVLATIVDTARLSKLEELLVVVVTILPITQASSPQSLWTASWPHQRHEHSTTFCLP
jgi:hypothetical protein